MLPPQNRLQELTRGPVNHNFHNAGAQASTLQTAALSMVLLFVLLLPRESYHSPPPGLEMVISRSCCSI
jgi:hypothetical protein